ncbi:pilus assembly protein [Marmoricola sp. Leaf446]|uniref:Flp family type IVb pilin n=1 Tax=Marmoricola sp. Leaf446 TaxID=1736379 RepID=UPI0006FA750D|nr:Flp family type IVb pilin [Marmoricola sp. Leaf446]KQT94427.1 pilus assembly protein [Marmoricola sp. Leaf446]
MIKLYVALQMLKERRDEEGASAVEYGLLVAAIAALVVAIVFLLGGVIKEVFTDTCTTVASKATTSATCA